MESPMEWQVHSLSHYNTFQLEDAQDMGLSVALLIPLDDAHKNNGSFKIHLFGGEDENISIQTTEIFPKVPAALANSRLNFPFNPSQQLIPDNCMAGTWRDAVTMISQNNITVTDSEGEIIPSGEFLRILSTVLVEPSTSQAAEKTPPGASLRFAIGMDEDAQPQMEVQGLPTPASNLQKKFFNGDNSVSILLGAYPLHADLFTGPFAKGLVPVFFSPNPEDALTFLSNNPSHVKDIISSVNSRFLVMEHM
jgi:hypothetical protein